MFNALTIDLEDWYQGLTSTGKQVERWSSFEDRVVESSERLLELLAAAGVKATFFVLGENVHVRNGFIQTLCDIYLDSFTSPAQTIPGGI